MPTVLEYFQAFHRLARHMVMKVTDVGFHMSLGRAFYQVPDKSGLPYRDVKVSIASPPGRRVTPLQRQQVKRQLAPFCGVRQATPRSRTCAGKAGSLNSLMWLGTNTTSAAAMSRKARAKLLKDAGVDVLTFAPYALVMIRLEALDERQRAHYIANGAYMLCQLDQKTDSVPRNAVVRVRLLLGEIVYCRRIRLRMRG